MTTTQTEQQSLDALLAGEIPPELGEALTKLDPRHDDCLSSGRCSYAQWDDPPGTDCHGTGGLPLPLPEAHVAAERWVMDVKGWGIQMCSDCVRIARVDSEGAGEWFDPYLDAIPYPDIFAAINAALGGE